MPVGRGALSLYKVRRSYDSFTLVDVELKTGRTHQIRVHLSWLKHPVVGDELYAGGRDNNVRDVQLRAQIRKLNRQFLHAEQLGFHHPRTGTMRFLPVTNELAHLLEKLETRYGVTSPRLFWLDISAFALLCRPSEPATSFGTSDQWNVNLGAATCLALVGRDLSRRGD